MAKKITSVISYIFHPIFMPLLGMVLILFTGSYLSLLTFEIKKAILLITGIFTILLPLSILPFLRYYKVITNYTIPKRQERLIPMLMSVAFYIFGYFLFKKIGIPNFLQQYILAAIISLGLSLIIHLKWKISTHMVGVGGVLGLISSLSYIFYVDIQMLLILAIFITGLVGSARLYLKAHSQSQIYAGFMLGYVVTFLVLTISN